MNQTIPVEIYNAWMNRSGADTRLSLQEYFDRGGHTAKLRERAVSIAKTEVARTFSIVRADADPDDARMNKLEARYAEYLEGLKLAGEILWWRFERVNLRLAANTHYRPDFMIGKASGIEFHETKGIWRDDARVKIKLAVELYPMFRFVAVQWIRKQKVWKFEQFGALEWR